MPIKTQFCKAALGFAECPVAIITTRGKHRMNTKKTHLNCSCERSSKAIAMHTITICIKRRVAVVERVYLKLCLMR